MSDFPRANLPANKSETNTDPIDKGIDAGERHANNVLDLLRALDGNDTSEGFAGGLLSGSVKWLAKHHGDAVAYGFVQRVADELAERIISAEPRQ